MNSKLILAAIVGGFFFLSGKKSSSKPNPSTDVPEDVDAEENVPVDNTPKNEKPTYKYLTPSRKKIITSYFNMSPLKTSEPFPFGDYSAWASEKQALGVKPLYQDWLANIIYWQISRVEGKTDLFTDVYGVNSPGYDGTLPYVLQKGRKAIIDLENPNPNPDIGGFKIVDIAENQSQANKRLAKGIALWKEIDAYVRANYKGCPQGAFCDLG